MPCVIRENKKVVPIQEELGSLKSNGVFLLWFMGALTNYVDKELGSLKFLKVCRWSKMPKTRQRSL